VNLLIISTRIIRPMRKDMVIQFMMGIFLRFKSKIDDQWCYSHC